MWYPFVWKLTEVMLRKTSEWSSRQKVQKEQTRYLISKAIPVESILFVTLVAEEKTLDKSKKNNSTIHR